MLLSSIVDVLTKDLLLRVRGKIDDGDEESKTWRLVCREFLRVDSLSRSALRLLRVEFASRLLFKYPMKIDADRLTNTPNYYLQWLDSQPAGSVLYVSLGSFLSVSSTQMDEIVAGVRNSGVRFLFVARGEHLTDLFKDGCGNIDDQMGFVVPWYDQLRVSSHSSVGGFWTHCGFNSTLEALYAGVPMLTFPIIWDQVPNSKQIAEDWKVGRLEG
ncbi:hypothetical protein Q3G72_000532 [Acer saccharum]|nr:hypothetical protein Q3G72_000532 [Acer saccharum]